MKSRAREILDKSIAAMLAAIEVYNKPTFSFREEAFSILAVNAWELLFKARILQLDKNRISAIVKYERRELADGSISLKEYRIRNRSGNHATISLFAAHDRLTNKYGDKIDPVVRLNLETMTELRDNAVHFINKEFDLRKKVHELGSANLKNYLHLVRSWFGRDLGEYQIFLLPIAFIHAAGPIHAVASNQEERRLLEYIRSVEKKVDDEVTHDFNLSISLDINVKRVADPRATKVVVVAPGEPDALPVTITEEDIREQFPWDYAILTKRLKERYSDFVENKRYHDLRRPLATDAKLCNIRYLDPGNPRSAKKPFFSPNIIKAFDKHYTRS